MTIRSCRAFRSGWIAGPLVLAILAACAEDAPVIDGDRSFLYDEFEVGPISTTVAEAGPGQIFENLTALALAPDQQSVYVLDVFAKRIHRIDLDGSVLASSGGPGAGPGELDFPVSIRAVREGVWVFDQSNSRATLFAPDGNVVEMVSLDDRAVAMPFTFAPVPGGFVVPGAVSPIERPGDGPLLSHLSVAGEIRTIGVLGEMPEVLAQSGFADRMTTWAMATVSEEEVVLVLVGSDLEGWTISLSDGSRWTSTISPLAIPQGIVEFAQGIEEEESVDLPDHVRLRVVSAVRVVDRKIWIMTTGLGLDLLGFTVPDGPGGNVSLVYPGSLAVELADGSGGWRGVTDAIVVGDRVVAVSATEILIADLRPRGTTPAS